MQYIQMTFLVACFLSHVSFISANEPRAGKQVEQTFQAADAPAMTLGYLLYLPENYAMSNERFPLVLFLHGSGERGNDLSLVKTHGPPKIVDQGRHLPFIVVSPQCPAEQRWNAKTLLGLLDDLMGKHSIDKDRIYVTGLSMGGSGTWSLIATEPDRFAAAIPICGRGDPQAAMRADGLPIWIVVGDKDRAQLVANCHGMVNSLQARGGDVKLSIYSGVGHDSWTQTYATPELYDWLLRHRASDRLSTAK